MLVDSLRRKPLVSLAVAATLLTIAIAVPVLQSPTERILGNEIVGRHPDAYMSMGAFRFEVGHKTQPGTDWIAAAFAAPFGVVAAFNIVVLITFPLTAVATYLLARHLAIAPAYAAFAGLLFAFSPFHLSHAAYHPHIAQTHWLPLYLLTLWRCLDRFSFGRAAVLLATTGMLALSNYYAGYFGAALTPVFLAAYWWASPASETRPTRNLLRTASLLLGSAAAAAIWPAYVYSRLDLGRLNLARPATELFQYGARWWSYLVPPVEHPLAGELAWRVWAREAIADGVVEQQLSLGLAVLVLAALPVGAWLRGRRSEHGQRVVPALVAVAAAAFVLSLAPASRAGAFYLLPGRFLYELAPVFRAFARFGAFFQLMVVLLAAMGLASLWRRRDALGRRLAVVLVSVAAIENVPYPPAGWHDVLPTQAHRWLAEQPGNPVILDCELEPTLQDRFTELLIPHPLHYLARGADCGQPHFGASLASGPITHLIVDRPAPEASFLENADASGGLRELARFDDSLVMEVVAEPADLVVRSMHGFSWREFADGGTFRWMGDDGRLIVDNTTGEPLAARLRLELQSFHRPRTVTVTIGGAEPIAVTAGTERGSVDLGPVEWPPGTTAVQLVPAPGAESPRQAAGSPDDRLLSIAVWDWQFED